MCIGNQNIMDDNETDTANPQSMKTIQGFQLIVINLTCVVVTYIYVNALCAVLLGICGFGMIMYTVYDIRPHHIHEFIQVLHILSIVL